MIFHTSLYSKLREFQIGGHFLLFRCVEVMKRIAPSLGVFLRVKFLNLIEK